MDDQQRKEAGLEAEETALSYLIERGLKLVLRNYRCRSGEIDLVMLEGATLVLIEVRYRSSDRFGGAAASVTYRKQRRIVNAARFLWVSHKELRRFPARFDVIALGAFGGKVDWIRNAFTL
jgi:putative endonuclease